MRWIIQDEIMGMPQIGSVNTPPPPNQVPSGQIVHAVERSIPLGGGEFLYLQGAAGTQLGAVVGYDSFNNTTTLAPAASSGTPVAVAQAATGAGQWGYYQITGATVALKDGTALTAGGPVGLGTINGTIGAVVATRQLIGAKVLNAAAAGAANATILLSRPAVAQS
jgi:hypothetical protein